jgi:Asparagine synthase
VCSVYWEPDIIDRRKQPFTAPYISWLTGPLKNEVEDLLLGSGYHRDLFIKREGLEKLIGRCMEEEVQASSVLWGFYSLFKWYDIYKG